MSLLSGDQKLSLATVYELDKKVIDLMHPEIGLKLGFNKRSIRSGKVD